MRVTGGRKPPTTPDAPNAKERQQIERVQREDRTRATQDAHHHPDRPAPPAAVDPLQQALARDFEVRPKMVKKIEQMSDPAGIWSFSDPVSIPNLVGMGVPSLIDMARHGHNSIDLQKVANPESAMPLVAGFAAGGPHFRQEPGLESIPLRGAREQKNLSKRTKVARRVQAALEASPVRQQAHEHFDATSPTPEAAQTQKDMYDARVHDLAQAVYNKPKAVRQIVDHLAGVGEAHMAENALGDLHFIYQADPPTVPELPKRIKGGPKAQEVYKLVTQGAAYKDWYQRASWVVGLAAKAEGITYDQMAQIVAITSQGANPTFNLRLALEAVQNYKKFGRVQIGEKAPYIFDPSEVESVLKGGTWEGRKRSSFYQNITHDTDHVTVDRHIAQMIFKTDSPTAKQYDKAEALFRDIAAQLGWSPKEVQAAAWVPWKAAGKAAQVAKRGMTAKPVEQYMPAAGDAYEQGWANAVTPPKMRPAGSKAKLPKLTENELNRVKLGYEQKKGSDLVGLPSKVKYRGNEIPVHSNAVAQSVADQYMQEAGLPYDPPHTYAKVDPARAKRIAEWYDKAVDAPNDPAVRAAYAAMAKETLAQYDAIQRAGFTFEFYPEGMDPYPGGPREAMIDLQQNRHMYVFPTDEGFGTENAAASTHPLLEDSGLQWNGKPVTHNDVFRAVHDFMGHFKEGVGFRADGEENAWRAHSAMYSQEARPAMTAETRGQNSWVNYGPHGEANRTAMQDTTVYADQKAVLAPDWVVNDGAHDNVPASDEVAAQNGTGSFATDAAQALDQSAAAARDIAKLLPEDQWPAWVKNQIRTQAVGRDAPIELPNPPSPLDENRGPSQRYMEFLAGKDTPDTFPGSWLSKISKFEGGLSSGIPIGFEIDSERGLLQRGPYSPHHESLNDLSQQVRKPRSRIAFNVVYKPIWKASRALQRNEWVTNTPGVRLLTSGERVIKQAGRDVRKESGRAPAAVYKELHVLAHIKEGSPEDIANFWYAQLPEASRNADGLRMIAERQRQLIDYITSGEAEKDLQSWADDVKGGDPFDAMQANEKIAEIRTDLPLRVESAAASVSVLERLAENPPAVNAEAMQAVDKLMADREDILTDGGRLDPERGENRKGQLARELGLESDGTEMFIGHRLPEPDASGTFQMPIGGVGRVKSPKGVGSPNHFILASTGRLRQSLHVVLEDWQSAQVFRQANTSREVLAKAGTPFEPGKVTEDVMIVNPKGRTIPAHWKIEELSQFVDGHEDSASLRKAAEDITGEFLLDPSDKDFAANLEAWKRDLTDKGVDWSELRIVPKRHVERFYKQFKSGGRKSAGAKAYDMVVDSVATSVVFFRIGYIPKNFAQNLVMAVPHQGPMLLVNATRAAQVLADPELRHLVHAEIGFSGPMAGLERQGAGNIVHRGFNKVASGVGKVADDPARFSAFLHEAAAEGVISKINPLLTEKDRAALHNLLTNPRKREMLNDISARATEAMADFSRMTPDQAKMARRFLVVPGWLMAGTRYPFHFAINHPVRSALMAYIAMGEPGAPDQLRFNKPIDEYFTHGVPSYLQGIPVAGKIFRTGSLTPVGTPWDLANAAVQTARGKGQFDYTHSTIFDFANPFIGAGVEFGQGGGLKSLERLVPNETFIRGMVHPKGSSSYPDDATRTGRLERELGVVPIHVGMPGGRKTAKSADQKATDWEHQTEKELGFQLPPDVVKARHTKATYHDAMKEYEKELGVKKLTDAQRTGVKLTILGAAHPEYAQTVETFKASLNDPHVQASIDRWAEKALGWTLVDQFSKEAQKVKKAHAAANH